MLRIPHIIGSAQLSTTRNSACAMALKVAKYEIQKPSNCFKFWVDVSRFFALCDQLITPKPHLLRVEEMQRVDWLICLLWIQDGGICCVASCEFDEKRATKAKFVAQSRPALYFLTTTFYNPQQMFLLRDKLITQGQKRETSTLNLQRNNAARQVEGFCISYFAAQEELAET